MTHLGSSTGPRAGALGPDGSTLPALLAARAAAQGGAAALLHKRHGIWHARNWTDLQAEVASLAAALAACGVAVNERVLIAGANRPRLLAGLLAAQRLGAVPVLAPQAGAGVTLAQALAETTPRVALVAGEHEVDAIQAAGGDAAPSRVVFDDGRGLRGTRQSRLLAWEAFAAGAGAAAPGLAVGAEAPAALVYAPDLAGKFRAVALSHRAVIDAAAAVARDHAVGPADRILAALPFGWGVPLLLGPVLALQTGLTLGFAESDATVLSDLREFGPTFLSGPDALFRRFRQIAFLGAAGAGWPWRGVLNRGLRLGPDGAAAGKSLAGALVVGSTRDQLGLSRLRHALCYGERPPPRVAAFWTALGFAPAGFAALAGFGLLGETLASPLDGEAAAVRARLRGSPYVRDAWLVQGFRGDLAALVAVDGEAVATWAQAQGLAVRSTEALDTLEPVQALIASEIAAAGTPDAPVRSYLLAGGGFDAASGEATPEGWLRPDAIVAGHAEALHRLRAGEGRAVGAVTPPAAAERRELADAMAAAAMHGFVI